MDTKQKLDKFHLCVADEYPFDYVQIDGLSLTNRTATLEMFDWKDIEKNRVSANLDSQVQIARGIADSIRVKSGRDSCIFGKVKSLCLDGNTASTFIGQSRYCRIDPLGALMSVGPIEYVDVLGTNRDEKSAITRRDSSVCTHFVHFGDIDQLAMSDSSQAIVFGNVRQLSYKCGSQILVFGNVERHYFSTSDHDNGSVDLRILPPCRFDQIGAVTVVELPAGDYLWSDISVGGLYTFQIDPRTPTIRSANLHSHALRYNYELALALAGGERKTNLNVAYLVRLIGEIARVMHEFGQTEKSIGMLSRCLGHLDQYQCKEEQDPVVIAQLCTNLADWYQKFNCHALGLSFARRADCLQVSPMALASLELYEASSA